MNETIINELSAKISVEKCQIENVLELLAEGATIPFIARYRKDKTGALDEEKIRIIEGWHMPPLYILFRFL